MKQFNIVASDGFQINVYYQEVDNARGIIQIVHGSKEHAGRYQDLMTDLAKAGYTSIAADHRGHGYSVDDVYKLGFMADLDQMIDDMFTVTKYIKSEHPSLGLTMIGHSLGSMFARSYLRDHDGELANLVLSGTVPYNAQAKIFAPIASLVVKFAGEYGFNKLLNAKSSVSDDPNWVSYNQENVKSFDDDPLCYSKYHNKSNLTLVHLMLSLVKYRDYRCNNPHLPILNIVGEDDIVVEGEAGLKRIDDAIKRCGYSDYRTIVYPHMKHEILNEDDRLTVIKDILSFIE